ncbi:DUF2793 domain-containing protein [Pseudorhizobium xiangyangii]|uniref:DUF2793 domain-containing protein n=1 Tax=Pseudorhizobium xiangyangii TaxID=2883104 RepID=UPI0021026804|nr:DUF2793 domain-containing protein [Neorhizobium xiangyangii]
MIATWQDGAWSFLDPREGWRAWFASAGVLKVFSSGSWRDIQSPSAEFDTLGVNATPDAINRLVVSSGASLFNHAGHGHQIKVNKATSIRAASPSALPHSPAATSSWYLRTASISFASTSGLPLPPVT